jgi:hypothetical protein
MKPFYFLTLLTFIFLSSCNMPGIAPTPTLIPPTLTPSPAPTQIPPSATPAQLTLQVTDELVNCRYGPGVIYATVNELRAGQSARVVGRNDTSTWWYIRDPGNPNGFCWLSSNVTEIKGEAEELPIEPLPPVFITAVETRIDPQKIFVKCEEFPQTVFFEAKITANGPALVTWKWEANTGSSGEETIIFEEAGTKSVNNYYQVFLPGDYWIKVRVLKPNEISGQVSFPANCTP